MKVKQKKQYLPEAFVLDKLLGKRKVRVGVLGGMDSVEAIELAFNLKNDDSTIVFLLFDTGYQAYFWGIEFTFKGIGNVEPEGDFMNEFYEKSAKTERSILEQALVILKDYKGYKKYQKSIEGNLRNTIKLHSK
ncbi:hypothetical protein [Bacillus sp. ISL-7]|uniref:hypothetical protein n=1 Tax=Bacillus sp. ISL-7 TaxID=2819136 RepID=UPI001BE51EAA|nr:hypothetical protein [Bacillus sp. ISL-7]MBT2734730.1 hypothetical protein [Bacillus sp. ISL-7]